MHNISIVQIDKGRTQSVSLKAKVSYIHMIRLCPNSDI
jgi:hypothetical protein